MKYAVAVAGFGAGLALAAGALAETKALATSGSWRAFGGTTNSGRGVCGISGDPGGRYFGLKFFAGDDTFVVQFQVPRVDKEAKYDLAIRFDANPQWTATGTGFMFQDGDAGIEFAINKNESDNFAREFKNSSRMVVQFTGGAYPVWTVGLEGTLAVSNAFSSCMRGL